MDAIFILMMLGYWGAMALMVTGLNWLHNPMERSA